MKKVFVINGFPGVGKTTFGGIVGELLEEKGINFSHLSSIDPIKHILRPRSQWDYDLIPTETRLLLQIKKDLVTKGEDWDGRTKDAKWRGYMSGLKTKVTEIYPDFINTVLVGSIHQLEEPGVAFVDIREPTNIEIFREFCFQNSLPDFNAIYVEGNVIMDFDNPSDAAVRDYEYDITITNNRMGVDPDISFRALEEEARKFIDEHILDEDEDREGELRFPN